MSKGGIKAGDPHALRPRFAQKEGTSGKGSQKKRYPFGRREKRGGERVKGQRSRQTSRLRGKGLGGVKQCLMPHVNTIKHAQRNRYRRRVVRCGHRVQILE